MIEPLAICPLSGWRFDSLPHGLLRLVIDYFPSPERMDASSKLSLPLGMHAEQARELAQALLNAANTAEQRATQKPQ